MTLDPIEMWLPITTIPRPPTFLERIEARTDSEPARVRLVLDELERQDEFWLWTALRVRSVPWFTRVKVLRLIAATEGIGRDAAERVLRRNGIDRDVRVVELRPEERRALQTDLEEHHPEAITINGRTRKRKAVVPLEERFWRFVPNRPTAGCWPWVGAVDRRGRPLIQSGRRGDGKLNARRLAWEIHNHELLTPRCIVVATCETRGCVRPDHLRKGTMSTALKGVPSTGHFGNGTANPNCKLTDAEVERIRELGRAGRDPEVIAARYRCTVTHVRAILRGARRPTSTVSA